MLIFVVVVEVTAVVVVVVAVVVVVVAVVVVAAVVVVVVAVFHEHPPYLYCWHQFCWSYPHGIHDAFKYNILCLYPEVSIFVVFSPCNSIISRSTPFQVPCFQVSRSDSAVWRSFQRAPRPTRQAMALERRQRSP